MNHKFDEKKKDQRELMTSILNVKSPTLNLGCWDRPVVSKVVSKFGSRRTLPNGHSYYHTGVDLELAKEHPLKLLVVVK